MLIARTAPRANPTSDLWFSVIHSDLLRDAIAADKGLENDSGADKGTSDPTDQVNFGIQNLTQPEHQ